MARGDYRWGSACSVFGAVSRRHAWRVCGRGPLPGDIDFTVGAAVAMPGLTAGTDFRARPPAGGAERARAGRDRRSEVDGGATRTIGRRLSVRCSMLPGEASNPDPARRNTGDHRQPTEVQPADRLAIDFVLRVRSCPTRLSSGCGTEGRGRTSQNRDLDDAVPAFRLT